MDISSGSEHQCKERSCVIIVDDERDFASGVARLISGHFADVDAVAVYSGREALKIISVRKVDVIITDLRMPEMGGMQLLTEVMRVTPGISIVVLTAYGSIETAVQALHAGAYDFITKPVETDQLFRVVERGLERSTLLAENDRLRQMLSQRSSEEDLIGEGEAMQRLKRTIAVVAQSNYTVLIRGESGTGKEMVARLLHRLSPRSSKPFVAVNCPSMPENLLESELFGYVRGAFTGADRDHKGLFATAESGTIHLDEIGDISPAVQTKLLRCLQDGEIRPVGSNQSRRVEVRVIASTNQDLESSLQSRTFREDLYYRLNVLAIFLPPLRQRLEDIPLLTHHFLNGACREMGLAVKEIEPQVLQWLIAQPWPGNVRQLQNFVRRLTVYSSAGIIDMDVVKMVQGDGVPATQGATEGSDPESKLFDYKSAKAAVVDTFNRQYMEKVLTQTRGNISQAARISGLSRVALQKILARIGERVNRFRP